MILRNGKCLKASDKMLEILIINNLENDFKIQKVIQNLGNNYYHSILRFQENRRKDYFLFDPSKGNFLETDY